MRTQAGQLAQLPSGTEFWRADAWWTCLEAAVEAQRVGGPIVRIRARDPQGEHHTFTMPTDMPIVVVGDSPVDTELLSAPVHVRCPSCGHGLTLSLQVP